MHLSVTHQRYVLAILLCEFIVMVVSGVGFNGLSGNAFFSLGVDPFQWPAYLLKIPQYILSNKIAGYLFDGLILLSLMLLIRKPDKTAIGLFVLSLMWMYYTTLTGYLGHRNYQAGMFLVCIPFIFKQAKGRPLAWEGLRYFLLIFYSSAALLKLYQLDLFNTHHFSGILQKQLSAYYFEHCTGAWLYVNQFLVNNPLVSHALFVGSIILEILPLAGFFTRKFDRWIAGAILLFHLASWAIMNIAPIGQVAFISVLFFSVKSSGQQGKG